MGKEMNINNVRMKLEIYQESGIIRIADCTAGDSLLHEGIIIESTTDSITVVVKKILSYIYDFGGITPYFKEGFCKVRKGARWGFVDVSLHEVFKPIYEEVHDFSEGFAAVKRNGLWGFIAANNGYPGDLEYDEVTDFCNEMSRVKIDEKYGFLRSNEICDDFSFSICIPIEFEDALPFRLNRDYTAVKSNGLWGIINKEGNWIIEPNFDKVSDTYPGYPMLVFKDGKSYQVLRNGELEIIK